MNLTISTANEDYIQRNCQDIMYYASVIEKRADDEYCPGELLLYENRENLVKCRQYGYKFILIDKNTT